MNVLTLIPPLFLAVLLAAACNRQTGSSSPIGAATADDSIAMAGYLNDAVRNPLQADSLLGLANQLYLSITQCSWVN
ncbi:hypothetical protein [Parapedobacter sp. ISTM3]|uniref:hypothetical protein n=1 Tax=Parapedobacter sp. ISTM3 TaxID=2800130 RepID=UPI001F1A4A05|nr:hypothetical protein [Parapedobacter sp. ISTM3]